MAEKENIHKIFYDDVREKKIISRGLRGRASRKKGFKGSVKLNSDMYKPSEIKKLHGEVIIYNMYDTIMNYDDFKQLDREEQKKAMKHWLYTQKVARSELAKIWSKGTDKPVRVQAIHDWVNRLGISQNKVLPVNQINNSVKEPIERPLHPQLSHSQKKPSFSVSWNESMLVSDFVERINKLAGALGLENECEITFELKEYKNKGRA